MSRSFALLGSGEFEPWTEPVDRWMLEHSSHPDGPVLILPTASAPEGDAVFDRWANMGLSHFGTLGIRAEIVPLKTKDDAERPELAARLDGAAFVFFSGGNPAFLARTLRGTSFWMRLLEGLDDGLGYAGCSAGVSCLGDICPDSSSASFDESVWQPGLSLFPGTFLGVHWDRLDSYVPGLTDLIVGVVPEGSRLVAVDENTALVGDGEDWRVMGRSKVHDLQADGSWRTWADGAELSLSLVPTA